MMAHTTIDFSNYIAERTRDFIGREWIITEIEHWLADSRAPQFYIITGDPGVGKTAFASHLVRSWPEIISAYHFCSTRRGGWIDPIAFSRSMARQLSLRYPAFNKYLLEQEGIHIEATQNITTIAGGQAINVLIETMEVSGVEDAFNRLVRRPLQQMAETGFDSQVVILVDGMDEALAYSGSFTIVDALARAHDLPSFIRIILTSRDERRVLRYWDTIPHFRIHAGGASNMGDIRAFVTMRLRRMHLPESFASHTIIVENVISKSAGNFLYVSHLMDTLEHYPDTQSVLNNLPEGLDGVYRMFLNSRDIGQDLRRWDERYLPVLGVLAISRETLSEEIIAAVTGLPRQQIAQTVRDLWQYLSIEPGEEKRYRIYHQSFVDFLLDRTRSHDHWIDAETWHRAIVTHYLGHSPRIPMATELMDIYGTRHLAFHLAGANLKQLLFALVEDKAWHLRKLDLDPTGRAFASDVEIALLESSRGGKQNISHLIALALLDAALSEPLSELHPRILAGLVTLGEERLALDVAHLITRLDKRCDAFRAIGEALWNLGKETEALSIWNQALFTVMVVPNLWDLLYAAMSLIKTLFNLKEFSLAMKVVFVLEKYIVQDDNSSMRYSKWAELVQIMADAGQMASAHQTLLRAIEDLKSILHEEESYGGGSHEDPPPHSYYTNTYEKETGVLNLAKVLPLFWNEDWCADILDQLSQLAESMPIMDDRYSGPKDREKLSKMRESIQKARDLIAQRGVANSRDDRPPTLVLAEEAIIQGDYAAVLSIEGYQLKTFLRKIVPMLCQGTTKQADAPSFGRFLANRCKHWEALAHVAVVFAKEGHADVARSLVNGALVAERQMKSTFEKVDTLVSCAQALTFLKDFSGAHQILETAQTQLTGEGDAGRRSYLAQELALSWQTIGETGHGVKVLLDTIPALSALATLKAREKSLQKLKTQQPSDETGDPFHKNMATRSGYVTVQTAIQGEWGIDEIKIATRPWSVLSKLQPILTTLDLNSVSPQRDALYQELLDLADQTDEHNAPFLAILLWLIALGGYFEVLDRIDRIGNNRLRANGLLILLKRMTKDVSGPQAVLLVEKVIRCTETLWAKEEISRVRSGASLAFLRLGYDDRAWELACQIEYNDLRVEALAAMLSWYRDSGNSGTVLEYLGRIQALLNTLWARIEAARGWVILAAACAWAGDNSLVTDCLKHANELTTHMVRMQRKKPFSFSIVPTSDYRIGQAIDSTCLENALGDLVKFGFAREALELLGLFSETGMVQNRVTNLQENRQ